MTNTQLHRRFPANAAAVVAVIFFGLAYISTQSPPPTLDGPVEKLRIALPVLPHGALVQIAAAKGYFTAAGLDIAIFPVRNSEAAIGELQTENVDFAVAEEVPFVISIMKGNAFGIVASVVVADDLAIIARSDHGIATARDLAGKKIGVSFGSTSSYFLWEFLTRHKVLPGSIVLVDLSPGRNADALANGSVDAVATGPPLSFQSAGALGKEQQFFTETNRYRSTFVTFGRSEFLEGHATAIEKFLRAMLAAEKFMHANPAEAMNLVARWLQVDADTLRPTWQQFDFRINLLQTQLVALEDQSRWAMARGYAAKGPTPNFLPNLYLDALLAVQPERVTVLR